MKVKGKRAAIAAVLAVLMVCLCACGNKQDNTEDIGKIMETAQKNLNAAESLSYDMLMSMDISSPDLGEQSIKLDMNSKIDAILSPMKMKMDMNMSMAQLGEMKATMYVVEEDGIFTAYTGTDVGSGSLIWGKQTVDGTEILNQYDAGKSADIYISNAENFKKIGEDTVNGKAATKYEGTISGESLSAVLNNTGVIDQYAALGLDEEAAKDILGELGSMQIGIWISDEDTIPVKFEMDMTSLLNTMMSKLLAADDETGGVAITINKTVITMTISNVNAVSDFEVPAEALEAQEITG